jgi:hypothetical protein
MKVIKILSYSFFLTIISIASCTTDAESIDCDLLYGRWDIKSAQRDGHPTETLTNTFFEFEKGGKMVTNFNLEGNEVSEKYEINGTIITQNGDAEIEYSIEKLEEGKLVLLTKLMDYEFTLNLVKKD